MREKNKRLKKLRQQVEEKGSGKFYRKARPGSWTEDLTPHQAWTVEEITAPQLSEFYPE